MQAPSRDRASELIASQQYLGADKGMEQPISVLHVTETYSGGVRRAIESYITHTPEFRHDLLFRGLDIDEPASPVARRTALRSQGIMLVREIRKYVRDSRPDIVHLHSSFAGLHGRLALPGVRPIYQPHAFYFTNPDLSPARRNLVKLVEAILARKTHFIALSDYELQAAESLRRNAPTSRIHNVPTLADSSRGTWASGHNRSVVMVGRIAAQKDPAHFAALAKMVRIKDPSISFEWIGDGNAPLRQVLTQNGVHVTGWLKPQELSTRLAESSIYYHSAKYEAAPLSVLDAAHVGVPIIMRDSPSLRSLPLTKVAGLTQAADILIKAMHSTTLLEEIEVLSREYRADHTAHQLRIDLRAAYRTNLRLNEGS